MKTWLIIICSYIHSLSSCEIRAWKKSGLNGIGTHDLCDTGAVLYQLSYLANWAWLRCEFVIYTVPADGQNASEYKKIYIWTAKRDMKTWSIVTVTCIQLISSCEMNAWKKFRLEQDLNPWPLRYQCGALPNIWYFVYSLVTGYIYLNTIFLFNNLNLFKSFVLTCLVRGISME